MVYLLILHLLFFKKALTLTTWKNEALMILVIMKDH